MKIRLKIFRVVSSTKGFFRINFVREKMRNFQEKSNNSHINGKFRNKIENFLFFYDRNAKKAKFSQNDFPILLEILALCMICIVIVTRIFFRCFEGFNNNLRSTDCIDKDRLEKGIESMPQTLIF